MITSTGSSQVKRVIQLQKKSKIRKENSQFVVEGVKMVCEAPFDRIEKVYMSERFATDNEDFVKKLGMSDDKVETVADNVFAHMSDTQTPQGVMAVINMKEYSVDDIIKAGSDRKPLIIAIENLQDPGNLGTIVRMAEGAGSWSGAARMSTARSTSAGARRRRCITTTASTRPICPKSSSASIRTGSSGARRCSCGALTMCSWCRIRGIRPSGARISSAAAS